jgi:transcriptional regulator with XRE-family HTH domain
MRTIAERLKWARSCTGLAQKPLGKLAGLQAERHVGVIEQGERTNFEFHVIEKLAAVLGVTTDWLGSGIGKRPSAADIKSHVAKLLAAKEVSGRTKGAA